MKFSELMRHKTPPRKKLVTLPLIGKDTTPPAGLQSNHKTGVLCIVVKKHKKVNTKRSKGIKPHWQDRRHNRLTILKHKAMK